MIYLRRVPAIISSIASLASACWPSAWKKLNDPSLNAPFFIIGAPRSGNTLLRRILCASQKIHIPPENYEVGRAIMQFKQMQHMEWRLLVRSSLSAIEYHPEFHTFELENLSELAVKLYQTPKEHQNIATILDAFYRYHAQKMGKMEAKLLWGDKTPNLTFWLKEISLAFPSARYIYLLRDGADVVGSFMKSGIEQDAGQASGMLRKLPFASKLFYLPEKKSHADAEFCARRWIAANEAARKHIKKFPQESMTIRYEDLVREPEVQTKRLCGFLNIPYDEAMIGSVTHVQQLGDVATLKHHANVMKPISTDSIGKGRASLSDEARTEIRKIINPHLVASGYEPL